MSLGGKKKQIWSPEERKKQCAKMFTKVKAWFHTGDSWSHNSEFWVCPFLKNKNFVDIKHLKFLRIQTKKKKTHFCGSNLLPSTKEKVKPTFSNSSKIHKSKLEGVNMTSSARLFGGFLHPSVFQTLFKMFHFSSLKKKHNKIPPLAGQRPDWSVVFTQLYTQAGKTTVFPTTG